jgi:hypothetical protein
MRNKNSRPRKTEGSKTKETPLDIPQDSLLERMLRFWGDSP